MRFILEIESHLCERHEVQGILISFLFVILSIKCHPESYFRHFSQPFHGTFALLREAFETFRQENLVRD